MIVIEDDNQENDEYNKKPDPLSYVPFQFSGVKRLTTRCNQIDYYYVYDHNTASLMELTANHTILLSFLLLHTS